MQQILPAWIDDVDPLEVYMNEPRPVPAGRPWVIVNMIAGLDGASALDGLSGGLGGPADKAVFRAVRACCDWILVASGTAAAERYRSPSPNEAALQRRLGAGRSAAPRLAIVTAGGALDPTIPALADTASASADTIPALADTVTASADGHDRRTVVITGEAADSAQLAELDAEVVRLPMPVPQPHAVLGELHQRGAAVVLCEGGPNWNGRMTEAGLVDELCLSISPILSGGTSPRIVADAARAVPVRMQLRRLLAEDDFLFARYTRP